MTTHRQRAAFENETDGTLESAIAWMAENMEADEVFSEAVLTKCVERFANPEDVFSTAELESWANQHGLVPEEEDK